MTFSDPRWLWGALAALILVPTAAAAHRRALAAVRRIDPAWRGRSGARAVLPALAAALLCAALARPQWGLRAVAAAESASDVVLLVDTSGSMLARDVPPDRFTRARLFARDFLRALPASTRVAIVRVEGDGEVVSPLTLDRAASEDAIEELAPRGASAPGSDLGRGLRTAAALLAARHAAAESIVLVSDGEDLDAGMREAAAECRRRGIVLDAAIVGTPAGAPVPARGGGILSADGGPVVSRAHPDALAAIAAESGGKLVDPVAVPRAAEVLAAAAGRSGSRAGRSPLREPVPRGSWPLAGAMAAWAGWWLPRRNDT